MIRGFVAVLACATPPAAIGQVTQAATPAQAALAQLAEAQRLLAAERFDSAVSVLAPILKRQPTLGRGWVALGNAYRGLHRLDAADSAYRKAFGTPAAAQAGQAVLGLYASSGQNDRAVEMLAQLRQNGVDFTTTAANPDLRAVRNDKRFAMFFPEPGSFSSPFVEDARILQEWRGERAGDEFGWIARGIGDVDQDGITDVVVSAPANPPYGKGDGRLYVFSGKSGHLLWKTSGTEGSLLGSGVESAGDVDGDGKADVIAGAPGMNTVFVYSGATGKQLYKISGDSADVDLGVAVSGIGDVDGDGRADFIASAPSSRRGGSANGRAYIYSGRTGTVLSTLTGEHAGDSFGSTLGGGDGRIIVGAAGAGDAHHGRIYVFDRLATKPTFTEDADSTGIALGNMFVSMIGDVDGDGISDIYATDFANTAKGRATGRVYVYSGKHGGVLRTFTGEHAGAGFGIGAARAGDIDGDGIADLVIGSWQYGNAAWSGGRVSVLSGKDGHALQTITGKIPGETLGFDAVAIGDVDHDGTTDYLLTSAWSMINGLRSGRVYIVSGTVARTGGARVFVVRLGTDTVAIERVTRSGDSLSGTVLRHTPTTTFLKYTIGFASDGTIESYRDRVFDVNGAPLSPDARVRIAGDSVVREIVQNGTLVTRRDAVSGAVLPMIGGASPFFQESAIAAVRKRNTSELLAVPIALGAQATTPFPIRLIGADSAEISMGQGFIRGYRLDANGHLLHGDASNTTVRLDIRPGSDADLEATARAWTQTGTMGLLSTRDSVVESVGNAHVTIDYGRPARRGRPIWGKLVPFDTVWRLGANAPTILRTDRSLKIGNSLLPAGSYSLWLIPSRTQPRLLVNRQTSGWVGVPMHDAAQDLATIPVKAHVGSPRGEERFRILVADGRLMMLWDDGGYEVDVRDGQ